MCLPEVWLGLASAAHTEWVETGHWMGLGRVETVEHVRADPAWQNELHIQPCLFSGIGNGAWNLEAFNTFTFYHWNVHLHVHILRSHLQSL